MTRRKLDAKLKVWQDARYREDLRTARIQLDMRNSWMVSKEYHPDGWTLEEILPRRGENGGKPSDLIERAWYDCRPEPTPERIAEFKALKLRSSMAVAAGKWDQPELWPLPS